MHVVWLFMVDSTSCTSMWWLWWISVKIKYIKGKRFLTSQAGQFSVSIALTLFQKEIKSCTELSIAYTSQPTYYQTHLYAMDFKLLDEQLGFSSELWLGRALKYVTLFTSRGWVYQYVSNQGNAYNTTLSSFFSWWDIFFPFVIISSQNRKKSSTILRSNLSYHVTWLASLNKLYQV